MAPAVPPLPVNVMGLEFRNPVGLAAGLDKNGDYIDAMARLGFGFIEVGTVTPRPQPGNPRPRLFRLPERNALINRFGFNNLGVDHLVSRVARARYRGILGINIGKNRDTPVEQATEDYLHCLRKVYAHADYVVVNISSPNTPGLRSLQHGDQLDSLLAALKGQQHSLAVQHDRHVPLVVKIAPDVSDEQLEGLARQLVDHGIEGVTATNTTLSREGVEGHRHAEEAGGLSGEPLLDRSTEVLRRLHDAFNGRMPLIGVGGILNGGDAVRKFRAGADLVQVYTGLIYRGPALVPEIVRALTEARAGRPALEGHY
jgi:dihydroorotate dehydrogenase